MKLDRYLVSRTVAAVGLSGAIIGGTAAIAGAWYEPQNDQQSYWSPGPPPGNQSANYCYVTTGKLARI